MRVLHEAINVVVRSLQVYELKVFVVKTRDLVEWIYIPLLVFYCYDAAQCSGMLIV